MNTEETVKPRKIQPQNVVCRLRFRETFGYKKPGTHFHTARQFYQNVFPNFTIMNVIKPPCFLRKFSPDGKLLLAFSADQTSIEIYDYKGPSAAGDLLVRTGGEYVPNWKDSINYDVRAAVFDKFFKLKFSIPVSQSNQQLNRECSLFTDDGKYVIVGSACYIPDDLRPHFYQMYTSNEAVTPNPRSPVEDYTLYLVDLQAGRLCDTRQFKVDKIYLSHNQGLYLFKDILAVLSIQHQTIHIFQILDGMFIDVRKIGRYCFDDDYYFINSVYPPNSISHRPFKDVILNSLKHRFLVFLYEKAASSETDRASELRRFYQHWDIFRSLRIWKMQLMDENHILIKYASEDVVTLKCNEPNNQCSFLVMYNMLEAKIVAIYDNTSKELVTLFEDFSDSFRNAGIHTETQFTCSPSNNIYAKQSQQRFKQTIVSAKNGGKTEATKRLLAQLPISAQSYSTSPYLDYSLFSYDDKWVSVMERPKACGEHPIRFYARDSGLLKFRMHAGVVGKNIPATARRLVAFIFHPTDPFAISVQRTNSEYVVNFHICHSTMTVYNPEIYRGL